MKRGVILAAVMAGSMGVVPALSADFSLGFDWGNLKKCTSGNPNSVPNPKFTLKGVPKGTASIQFRMTDLNVPSYNHGGGTVKYSSGSSIAPGAFKYRSPCPPDGTHNYQWTATAKDAGGKKLGEAKARKAYP
jgi:phosphatidylethanolamine-binding protein (PEBP) family uncharacterized protein